MEVDGPVYCRAEKSVAEEGRTVYMDHSTQTSYWIPPSAQWQCLFGLPYGWEIAVDTAGKLYYINHIEQKTTYADPRVNIDDEDGLTPRNVTINRHPELGYGFVAGSERPVIIRFVTEGLGANDVNCWPQATTSGGPSINKLLPGDHILAVNGEDVTEASKDHVVNLVRSCSTNVSLSVCQPQSSDASRKSAILSASKRAKLKHTPSRVRFAEGVVLGPDAPNGSESCVPFMPNVMRVFLENGQTRSFKYDLGTTVQDVLEALGEKLALQSLDNFALMLEHPQGPRSNKLSLLKKDEKLARIAARPGSQHFRCLLRVAFVPPDPLELHKSDHIAFDYYYQQCVNDVVAGRHAYEMRYEACVRLAALQMQQTSLDTKMSQPGAKVSLKLMEKEYGLNSFLPTILLENVKRKEIRKHLRFYLKRDIDRRTSQPTNCIANTNAIANSLSASSSINVSLDPSLSLRIKYINMLSHLPTFGGRSFCVTFRDTKTDMLMQVHPKQGILLRGTGRSSEPAITIQFDLITQLLVTTETDVLKLLTMHLKTGVGSNQTLEFLIDKDDIEDLVLYTQGYFKLLLHHKLPCQSDEYEPESPITNPVPPYHGLHSVRPAGWNYDDPGSDDEEAERLVDLSRGPPPYPGSLSVPLSKKVQFDEAEGESDTSPLINEEQISVEVHRSGSDSEPVSDDVSTELVSMKTIAKNKRVRLGSADSMEDNYHPRSFLRAKDSLLIRDYKPEVDDHKPKTFLRARDSLLIKHRDRAGTWAGTNATARAQQASPTEDESTVDRTLSSELSSSDTESQCTPNESPIHRAILKKRPNQLVTAEARPSFGLKSPDTLPCAVLSDGQIEQIVSSCGVEGETLEELLLLFPDNLCTDSEIIDLTMLPSPCAQGEVPCVDPASLSSLSPPTPFRDELDPKEQFAQVMERLAEGDVRVIEDSHQAASQHCRHKRKTSLEAVPTRPQSQFSSSYPSIDRNFAEFERFLKTFTIPPPPDFSLDKSHRALDTAADNSKHVRFVPAKRSASGDIGSLLAQERRFLANKRFNTFLRRAMSDDEDSQDWVEFLATHDAPEKKTEKMEKPNVAEQGVRRVSLRNFSGLELSDHEPPQVTKLPLKDFVGLEVLERGIASIEVGEHPSRSRGARMSIPVSVGDRRKLMARIRSVDPHPEFVEPETTALKQPRKISAHKVVLPSRPLNVIEESSNSPESIPTLPESPPKVRSYSMDARHTALKVGNGFVPEEDKSPSSMELSVASAEIAKLKEQLKGALNKMPSRSPKRTAPDAAAQNKIRLLTESQQFALATKLLVRSGSDLCSDSHLTGCLGRSMAKAKTMTTAAEQLLRSCTSIFQAQILSAKVSEVLNAFDLTVESLGDARGKELGAPEMKKLMRQSTTLAATLTQLIQAVREA